MALQFRHFRLKQSVTTCVASLLFCFHFLNGAENSSARVEVRYESRLNDIPLSDQFSGLSFEMERLLPDSKGAHYFRPDNGPLSALFRTLGVKSLRIGGNTADRPTVQYPSFADIDQLFAFARKAEVKVIFTLRLREGDPRQAGAVARYIMQYHSDALWCFAIGNEPNVFAPDYADFLVIWKKFADVVNAPEFAPAARFAGPSSTAGNSFWTRDFAREFENTRRLVVATQHIYPGGNADLQSDPAEARRLMLSRAWVRGYQQFHDTFVPGVLATGIPYRLGETNSFWNGGRVDASNTFAAALWALDYQHWWAQHGAHGLNFHTGDFVAKAEENTRSMYSAFWSTRDGYEAKAVAYALTAFSQGAHGRVAQVRLSENPGDLNLTAYAMHGPDGVFVTLINKGYGTDARAADVGLITQAGASVQVLLLNTPDGDVARTTGFTLGGGKIHNDGSWSGRWTEHQPADSTGRLVVRVPPASAAIVKLPPAKAAEPTLHDGNASHAP